MSSTMLSQRGIKDHPGCPWQFPYRHLCGPKERRRCGITKMRGVRVCFRSCPDRLIKRLRISQKPIMTAVTHWVCPSCAAWVPLALDQCPGCKHVHMAALTHWVCPSCTAWVPLALHQCPGCKHVHTGASPASQTVAPTFKAQSPPWVRAVSIPTALVGIVAFFLPWVQFSCGPIALGMSGYEIATGSYAEKFGQEHQDEFQRRLEAAMDQASTQGRGRRTRPKPFSSRKGEPEPHTGPNVPLLWIVPLACGLLFLLGVFGVPRVPTLLVSVVASAYLAYFGVTTEQQMTDPQYTGGILTYSWMWGFWACWVGLVAPAVAALLKPRSNLTTHSGLSMTL